MIRIRIPSFKKIHIEHDKSYTVFCTEVFVSGRSHVVYKRYSAFEELHKKLKKILVTPEFPPKKVRKWNPKVLEQRRAGLEVYLQRILEEGMVPKILCHFLEINSLIEDAASLDSMDPVEDAYISHQPLLAYTHDPFIQEPVRVIGSLPDIITHGAMQGLYGSADDLR